MGDAGAIAAAATGDGDRKESQGRHEPVAAPRARATAAAAAAGMNAPTARRRHAAEAEFPMEYLLIFIVLLTCAAIVAYLVAHDESASSDGGGGAPNQRRVEDTTFELRVSLETAYQGLPVQVEYPGGRQVQCSICHGEGGVGPNGMQKCPVCQGSGAQTFRFQVAPGYFQTMRQTCSKCNGKGKHIAHECPKCHGKGVHRQDGDINIPIDQGLPEGHVMRLRNRGHQVPGLKPGDVVVKIRTEPHAVFTRSGPHLHHTHVISLKEALLGFRLELSHLDGHVVVIDRRERVTSPSLVLELAGEGMPVWRGPRGRGTHADASHGTAWAAIRALFRVGSADFDDSERTTEDDGDVRGKRPSGVSSSNSPGSSSSSSSETDMVETLNGHAARNTSVYDAQLQPLVSHGSLFVHFKVKFPAERALSAQHTQAIRQLLS